MLCAKLSLVKVTGFPAEVITVCDFFDQICESEVFDMWLFRHSLASEP